MAVGRLAEVERAVEVDRQHPTPVLAGQVFEGDSGEDAGVAHGGVEAAELVERGLHDRLATLRRND